MRAVRNEGVIGLACPIGLLLLLTGTGGLDAVGWSTGLVCAGAITWLVDRGRGRSGLARLGPADCVTLLRAGLVAVVLALLVQTARGGGSVTASVVLASIALALDWVDGRVARRTSTVTEFGARFDMEVDAFLILVLSVAAAQVVGWWVLAIGLARYLFVAAGWCSVRMRARLPYRYWRKPVAAVQGISLVVAVSRVLPTAVSTVVLCIALALLTESFGRDVVWLWRR